MELPKLCAGCGTKNVIVVPQAILQTGGFAFYNSICHRTDQAAAKSQQTTTGSTEWSSEIGGEWAPFVSRLVRRFSEWFERVGSLVPIHLYSPKHVRISLWRFVGKLTTEVSS